jgi:hypothetical protein
MPVHQPDLIERLSLATLIARSPADGCGFACMPEGRLVLACPAADAAELKGCTGNARVIFHAPVRVQRERAGFG